ncbi:hypothetical protein CPB83DRAFT_427834 [Crepidotus variabilis]|uniref:Uncharacterized protein n=1 Tax=Crepidotus variabilis TaxID=179855 RepID=A0A9P6EED1_9AGAR|nr:hypothetical protein CPB83DRAFT_427834 [Crepidotus variabilis]
MPSVTAQIPTHLPPAKPDHEFTKKPSSRLGVFFWRWRMWFESTFVFSMLEPWEKVMLLIIISFLFLLLGSSVLKYLPQHLRFLRGRAVYYLWGQDGDERLLWQWLGLVGDSANAIQVTNSSLLKEL